MANEKKYIDVEKAIKEIAETNIIQYEVDIEGFAKSQIKITLQRDTKQAIIDLLGNIPAADVVEPVYCKDCKFFDLCGDTAGVCRKHDINTYADDYCSYGERKDDYNEN